MDFFQIKERSIKKGVVEVYPDFKVCRSNDIMIRGGKFYAVWDQQKGLWSTDEYDVRRLVDDEIFEYRDRMRSFDGETIVVKSMANFSSGSWVQFRKYINHVSDNDHQLDEKLTFSNTKVSKKDYISRRLSYPLEPGLCDAYEEIISTLYTPEERDKLEWAIGSIIAGDSKDIQKFIVLYGEAGAGKSTILNIIQKLFKGYYTTFDARALASSNNTFASEVFKTNPLVAIQHDGDLSRIEDNTKLNSIVSHEEMPMNEKFKSSYTFRPICFLFMATNRPVKITDAKSGIIRRLIDVKPSGNKLPPKRYHELMDKIDFELGAIAHHCLEVYQNLGRNYYSSYRPMDMIFQTDVFFNFVESYYDIFRVEDGVTLSKAYDMYKAYCDEALVDFKLARHKFREELKNYFKEFYDVTRVDGKQIRSYYKGFISEKIASPMPSRKEEKTNLLVLDKTESLFDNICASCKAQYASDTETPKHYWDSVTTTLSSIDTHKVHYVMLPLNHIVVDFDLKDESGNKSEELNLEAASKWPATYAEYSKGGSGIHLHYIYTGDPTKLSRIYSEGIEIKVFTGNSSLRRKLTKCNDIPIAVINSGLPLKGEKMINFEGIKSERSLRELIRKNLNKEVHPATKPSIDFIYKILEDAYNSGVVYDVTDMRHKIMVFANNSSNQADYCVRLVGKMKFKSEVENPPSEDYKNDKLVFFDVEVFPNLFLINWKFEGPDATVVRMINPSSKDVEELLKCKLVGFNCRRYDNHILYGRYLGYSNLELYHLSQRLVNDDQTAMFREAFNISYTDVYDFSSEKKSLKKFEIDLGIHHQELGLPWDEPVPEDKWEMVAEYCDNDVIATEAVFNARSADWTARKILANLAGLTVNDKSNTLTTKIIFGEDKNPQSQFNYRDLGYCDVKKAFTMIDDYGCDPYWTIFQDGKPIFPGYKFENGKSTYREEVVGEGGYVYAEPGMYWDVALLDVASMHPSSVVAENLFGDKYTKNFNDILQARIAIKHKDFDSAKKMLDGRLAPFLDDPSIAKELSGALKIPINSVYGLTSARFPNAFKDPRNKDNIVAKRGALFMINLKHEVQKRGFTVAHIKTDSIKIPNATPEIIEFVMNYGKLYGYNFEHEETYDRMCLVNDSVYIARYKEPHIDKGTGREIWWSATGAQFAHPFVFKTLFSKEPLEFRDFCETKTVKTAMYLDMNENLPENEHDYKFIGKAGSFCPIKPGKGGGMLMCLRGEKYHSVTGTKEYRWLESELVDKAGIKDDIDDKYFKDLADAAIENISQYGDFELFVAGTEDEALPPWLPPCGDSKYSTCFDCSKYKDGKCTIGHDLSNYIMEGNANNGN